jgi:hypothetical protein
MQNVPHPLSLQEFLLAYATGGVLGSSTRSNQAVPLQRGTTYRPLPSGLTLSSSPETRLRAEVMRHLERTTTVVTPQGIETTTRCWACTDDPTYPCRALKVLALPYATHPAYRTEWHINAPPAPAITDETGR